MSRSSFPARQRAGLRTRIGAADLAGNKLTASDGTLTITATYDRLGRVLTVDDEDAGTTADTTYTYSLTSPSWTDPSGSYAATLDKFDRATALTDPASTSAWAWTYGTGGQVLSGTPGNSNTLDQTYDAVGHLLDRETKTGGTSRAHYVYTYNRAGMILSEASTITGDPANGTVAYAYDPLGQLTGSTFSGTTTAYGWDTTTNRTSVQVGSGTAATTAYDAANRPTGGANPTAAYTSDADGRLTARPNQTMTWDHLGRLTAVKDAAGTTTLAASTYDPLDRLRTVDYGGGNRIRFRYTGLTTSAAQWLDDVAGTVTRSIGNGWGGERLMDWTGTSSNRRYYGTNAHHDVTWLADSSGAVSQSLRYDPWGTPRSTVPTGYTPFRFQGSWYDTTTDLSWVVTRWYAQSLGRFISEDTLLGEPREPDSRHLYAYAAGEPVGAWDPSGRRWFRDYDDHDQTFWAKTLTALCIGLSIFAVPVSAGTTAAAAAAFCLGQSFIALIAPRTNLVVRTFFNFVIHGGREPGLWVSWSKTRFIRYWDERHQETRDAVDVWDPHPTEGRAFRFGPSAERSWRKCKNKLEQWGAARQEGIPACSTYRPYDYLTATSMKRWIWRQPWAHTTTVDAYTSRYWPQFSPPRGGDGDLQLWSVWDEFQYPARPSR